MKQNFKLNINQPCPKKFENFEATQNGGFCASCQTEVIDFTKMSEDEIKEYFKNYSKKVCGHFHDSQLKTYSNHNKTRKRKIKLSLGVLGLSVLSLFSFDVYKTENLEPTQKLIIKDKNTTKALKSVENHIVEGVVIDEEYGEPLIGVSVYLKHNVSLGTLTDVEGKFRLEIPASEFKGTLVFSSLGYGKEELILSKKNTKANITMKLVADCIMIGEVSVNQIYQSKLSLWQRFKNIFRRKSKKI